MNKKVLNFINKIEGWKTAIKSLHWDSDSLSQHELCDKIADSISDFQDKVSEVEQSITGKLAKNKLKGEVYKVTNLKKFVEDVLDDTNTFYKSLEDEGDTYTGMRSDCESFLSDMQRNLYLVNFTMKEDLKRRLMGQINESRPKNIAMHDDVDKFIGRRPKTVKSRINQIYKIVKRYGIDSKRYHDDHWQAIDDYYKAISSLGCDVEMKPCASLNKADSFESDGGYTDYDSSDNMPRSKQYYVKITFEDGMLIDGYIKCMACGTMEDPFNAYDTCIVLWPKNSNRMLEGKEMKLTESELKEVIKESVLRVLKETELNYDVDNFSGRWRKNVPEMEFDIDDYLDNPYDVPNSFDDDEWVDGDKDMENDYSWDAFDKQAVSHGVEPYYRISKNGVPSEIDKAISMRNRDADWSERELRNGRRMMDKYVNGQRDADDVGDAWDDIHYESRIPKGEIKLTEEEFRNVIKESVNRLLKEYGEYAATREKMGRVAKRGIENGDTSAYQNAMNSLNKRRSKKEDYADFQKAFEG